MDNKSKHLRKLRLFFTRDFNQWTNEMSRNMYKDTLPKLWGKGLEDQIVRYTGRAFEWLRYEDDYAKLMDFMIHKDFRDEIFSSQLYKQFLCDVEKVRRLISIDPKDILDVAEYYEKIRSCCFRLYPLYALSVFFPGHWKESIEKIHGKDASSELMNRYMQGRAKSEGVLKEIDLFFRSWFGLVFESHGYSRNFVKLLSFSEVERFVYKNAYPKKNTLEERSKGFVYIDGAIHPTANHRKFLEDRGVCYPFDDLDARELQGTVSCAADTVIGNVQVIMNQQEAAGFRPGSILVSTMTSPEYMPAIRTARALVTDEGGVTCHAAIVSRELGIPCIIGTKTATQVLKDGDTVRVDTNTGIITILD